LDFVLKESEDAEESKHDTSMFRQVIDLTEHDDTNPNAVNALPQSVAASSFVEIPAHPMILRTHKSLDSYDQGQFRGFPVNPSTRERQLRDQFGQPLGRALSKLKRWEQAHELSYLFGPLDVLLVFAVEEQKLLVGPNGRPANKAHEADIVVYMAKHGFKWSHNRTSREPYCGRYTTIIRELADAIKILESTPVFRVQPPPIGHIVVQIPGHMGERFTLIDSPVNYIGSGAGKGWDLNLESACPRAAMELYQDTKVMLQLNIIWWSRFRLVDTTLKLWLPGQSFTDVNPQVLQKDNPLQRCYPPFWVKGFSPTSHHGPGLKETTIKVWCQDHGRIEALTIRSTMAAQLSTRCFSYKQWAALAHDSGPHLYTDHPFRKLTGKSAIFWGAVTVC
jgi:hypothetical protein